MKTYLHPLMLAIALVALSTPHASATPNTVEILNDTKMAAIQGGICPYFRCQDGDGDGVCQPIPDDPVDLCSHISCKLELDSDNGMTSSSAK